MWLWACRPLAVDLLYSSYSYFSLNYLLLIVFCFISFYKLLRSVIDVASLIVLAAGRRVESARRLKILCQHQIVLWQQEIDRTHTSSGWWRSWFTADASWKLSEWYSAALSGLKVSSCWPKEDASAFEALAVGGRVETGIMVLTMYDVIWFNFRKEILMDLNSQ